VTVNATKPAVETRAPTWHERDLDEQDQGRPDAEQAQDDDQGDDDEPAQAAAPAADDPHWSAFAPQGGGPSQSVKVQTHGGVLLSVLRTCGRGRWRRPAGWR
jgi:hypothetical protein